MGIRSDKLVALGLEIFPEALLSCSIKILLYQGRGKPNVESLKKGFDQLKNELARFCEKKGININDPEFKEILAVTLNEDHMCIFKQILKQ